MFSAVGQWYANFSQTSDDEVTSLLEAARRHVRAEAHDADADEKLDDLHKTLEHASDMIDEISDKDESE